MWRQQQQLVLFSVATMAHDARGGSHDFFSTAATVLSSAVACTFLVVPCVFCCTAWHLGHGVTAASAVEPLAPMALEETGGGERTESSDI